LTGLELGANASGKAQLQDDNVIGRPADAVDACCHPLMRVGIVSLNPLRMNENVRLRPGLAEQNAVRRAVELLRTHTDCAAAKLALAGGADALPARIRQRIAGTFGRVENRFTCFAGKRDIAFVNRDRERHETVASPK